MRRLSLLAMLSMLAMLVFSPTAFAQSEQNDLDCEDFESQAEAQAELRSDPSDPNGLDGNDDDGIACESLPGPRDEVPVQGAIGNGGGTEPPPVTDPNQDVDCSQLGSSGQQIQQRAQAILNQDPSDPNGLDADNDGVPCEFTESTGQFSFEDGTELNVTGVAPTTPPQPEAPQEQMQDLPDTGGPALLLPVSGLALAGLGALGLGVSRRRR